MEKIEQQEIKLTCYNCGGPVVWQNDFDFEDYGRLGEGIVHVYQCGDCNTMWEGYNCMDDEEDREDEDV